jgi:hypothetical protein
MDQIQRKRPPLKLAAVLTAIALSVIVYAVMPGSESEPGGFRGIEWGADLGKLSGMSIFAEDGDLKFYVRSDDRMKLGDVPLEKLIYGFYKGRFYNVMMYVSSQASFARVQEVLSRQYGAPYQPTQSEKKYFWDDGNVSVLSTYDDDSNTGRISYIFKPIDSEMSESAPPQTKESGS